MPKTEPFDEQKQVNHILKSWNAIRHNWLMGWGVIFIVVFFQLLKLNYSYSKLALLAAVWLCTSIPVVAILIKRERAFLHNLTVEELKIIERAAKSGDAELMRVKTEADLLLRMHKEVIEKSQKELLRASAPSDDGTLLRPTTENHQTPNEELLQASDEDSHGMERQQ